MKKAVLGGLALILLGLIAWRVYESVASESNGGRRRGPRAVAVAVTPIKRETIRDIGEFTGTLVPKTHFTVAPEVSGRLKKLNVDSGDTVKSGDLIALIDSEEYELRVKQAEAELEVSRANLAESKSTLNLAEREYERAKALNEKKVASHAEFEEAEARLRAAEAKYRVSEAQIKQREAALATAKVQLSYTRIKPTWDAADTKRLVAERFADEGDMLRANDPIVSIIDASTVIAVINVIERDDSKVKVGQTATVTTDAYPNRTWSGVIARRAPALREESRQSPAEIEIPNPELMLKAGMFVRARILLAEHENAVVVPFSALCRRNGRQGVFMVEEAKEGKTGRFVPITVGITNGDQVEVLEPVLDGRVITLGHHLLEDGGAVTIPEEDGKKSEEKKPEDGSDKSKGGKPAGGKRS